MGSKHVGPLNYAELLAWLDMLCLLTLITCAHAGSFYFKFCYFAGSDSWTSLRRFACFAQLGAHMTRSRGSPPLGESFDLRALVCFANLLDLLKMKVPHKLAR